MQSEPPEMGRARLATMAPAEPPPMTPAVSLASDAPGQMVAPKRAADVSPAGGGGSAADTAAQDLGTLGEGVKLGVQVLAHGASVSVQAAAPHVASAAKTGLDTILSDWTSSFYRMRDILTRALQHHCVQTDAQASQPWPWDLKPLQMSGIGDPLPVDYVQFQSHPSCFSSSNYKQVQELFGIDAAWDTRQTIVIQILNALLSNYYRVNGLNAGSRIAAIQTRDLQSIDYKDVKGVTRNIQGLLLNLAPSGMDTWGDYAPGTITQVILTTTHNYMVVDQKLIMAADINKSMGTRFTFTKFVPFLYLRVASHFIFNLPIRYDWGIMNRFAPDTSPVPKIDRIGNLLVHLYENSHVTASGAGLLRPLLTPMFVSGVIWGIIYNTILPLAFSLGPNGLGFNSTTFMGYEQLLLVSKNILQTFSWKSVEISPQLSMALYGTRASGMLEDYRVARAPRRSGGGGGSSRTVLLGSSTSGTSDSTAVTVSGGSAKQIQTQDRKPDILQSVQGHIRFNTKVIIFAMDDPEWTKFLEDLNALRTVPLLEDYIGIYGVFNIMSIISNWRTSFYMSTTSSSTFATTAISLFDQVHQLVGGMTTLYTSMVVTMDSAKSIASAQLMSSVLGEQVKLSMDTLVTEMSQSDGTVNFVADPRVAESLKKDEDALKEQQTNIDTEEAQIKANEAATMEIEKQLNGVKQRKKAVETSVGRDKYNNHEWQQLNDKMEELTEELNSTKMIDDRKRLAELKEAYKVQDEAYTLKKAQSTLNVDKLKLSRIQDVLEIATAYVSTNGSTPGIINCISFLRNNIGPIFQLIRKHMNPYYDYNNWIEYANAKFETEEAKKARTAREAEEEGEEEEEPQEVSVIVPSPKVTGMDAVARLNRLNMFVYASGPRQSGATTKHRSLKPATARPEVPADTVPGCADAVATVAKTCGMVELQVVAACQSSILSERHEALLRNIDNTVRDGLLFSTRPGKQNFKLGQRVNLEDGEDITVTITTLKAKTMTISAHDMHVTEDRLLMTQADFNDYIWATIGEDKLVFFDEDVNIFTISYMLGSKKGSHTGHIINKDQISIMLEVPDCAETSIQMKISIELGAAEDANEDTIALTEGELTTSVAFTNTGMPDIISSKVEINQFNRERRVWETKKVNYARLGKDNYNNFCWGLADCLDTDAHTPIVFSFAGAHCYMTWDTDHYSPGFGNSATELCQHWGDVYTQTHKMPVLSVNIQENALTVHGAKNGVVRVSFEKTSASTCRVEDDGKVRDCNLLFGCANDEQITIQRNGIFASSITLRYDTDDEELITLARPRISYTDTVDCVFAPAGEYFTERATSTDSESVKTYFIAAGNMPARDDIDIVAFSATKSWPAIIQHKVRYDKFDDTGGKMTYGVIEFNPADVSFCVVICKGESTEFVYNSIHVITADTDVYNIEPTSSAYADIAAAKDKPAAVVAWLSGCANTHSEDVDGAHVNITTVSVNMYETVAQPVFVLGTWMTSSGAVVMHARNRFQGWNLTDTTTRTLAQHVTTLRYATMSHVHFACIARVGRLPVLLANADEGSGEIHLHCVGGGGSITIKVDADTEENAAMYNRIQNYYESNRDLVPFCLPRNALAQQFGLYYKMNGVPFAAIANIKRRNVEPGSTSLAYVTATFNLLPLIQETRPRIDMHAADTTDTRMTIASRTRLEVTRTRGGGYTVQPAKYFVSGVVTEDLPESSVILPEFDTTNVQHKVRLALPVKPHDAMYQWNLDEIKDRRWTVTKSSKCGMSVTSMLTLCPRIEDKLEYSQRLVSSPCGRAQWDHKFHNGLAWLSLTLSADFYPLKPLKVEYMYENTNAYITLSGVAETCTHKDTSSLKYSHSINLHDIPHSKTISMYKFTSGARSYILYTAGDRLECVISDGVDQEPTLRVCVVEAAKANTVQPLSAIAVRGVCPEDLKCADVAKIIVDIPDGLCIMKDGEDISMASCMTIDSVTGRIGGKTFNADAVHASNCVPVLQDGRYSAACEFKRYSTDAASTASSNINVIHLKGMGEPDVTEIARPSTVGEQVVGDVSASMVPTYTQCFEMFDKRRTVSKIKFMGNTSAFKLEIPESAFTEGPTNAEHPYVSILFMHAALPPTGLMKPYSNGEDMEVRSENGNVVISITPIITAPKQTEALLLSYEEIYQISVLYKSTYVLITQRNKTWTIENWTTSMINPSGEVIRNNHDPVDPSLVDLSERMIKLGKCSPPGMGLVEHVEGSTDNFGLLYNTTEDKRALVPHSVSTLQPYKIIPLNTRPGMNNSLSLYFPQLNILTYYGDGMNIRLVGRRDSTDVNIQSINRIWVAQRRGKSLYKYSFTPYSPKDAEVYTRADVRPGSDIKQPLQSFIEQHKIVTTKHKKDVVNTIETGIETWIYVDVSCTDKESIDTISTMCTAGYMSKTCIVINNPSDTRGHEDRPKTQMYYINAAEDPEYIEDINYIRYARFGTHEELKTYIRRQTKWVSGETFRVTQGPNNRYAKYVITCGLNVIQRYMDVVPLKKGVRGSVDGLDELTQQIFEDYSIQWNAKTGWFAGVGLTVFVFIQTPSDKLQVVSNTIIAAFPWLVGLGVFYGIGRWWKSWEETREKMWAEGKKVMGPIFVKKLSPETPASGHMQEAYDDLDEIPLPFLLQKNTVLHYVDLNMAITNMHTITANEYKSLELNGAALWYIKYETIDSKWEATFCAVSEPGMLSKVGLSSSNWTADCANDGPSVEHMRGLMCHTTPTTVPVTASAALPHGDTGGVLPLEPEAEAEGAVDPVAEPKAETEPEPEVEAEPEWLATCFDEEDEDAALLRAFM
jgi:hypothetical protein